MPARKEVLAALDLGTNNCRLLIANPAPQGFVVIDAFSRIVRLGQGLTASGRLSEPAMSRTIEALRVCADKIARSGATRSRAVATQACRQAANCEEFLGRVKAETGLELEIISSSEEARLGNVGCSPLIDPAVRYALVFDIGGGSTEISWLEVMPRRSGACGIEPKGWCSVPLGVVSMAETYGGQSVSPRVYEKMVQETLSSLQPFEAAQGISALVAGGRVQMLGTSGTVTTLTGVHKGLLRYDRSRVDGSWLELQTIRATTERVLGMSYRERIRHGCIGRQRADLVIAGCAILEAICRLWPVARLRVADRGLREGILLSLIGEMKEDSLAQRRSDRA